MGRWGPKIWNLIRFLSFNPKLVQNSKKLISGQKSYVITHHTAILVLRFEEDKPNCSKFNGLDYFLFTGHIKCLLEYTKCPPEHQQTALTHPCQLCNHHAGAK